MKKIIATTALVAAAAAVTAQTVTSANIVGYSKNTQPLGGFSIVAPAQFSGSDSGVVLSNAFSGMVGGEKVYVFNDPAYVTYDYFAGYGWFDGLFAPAGGVVLPDGASVWLTGAPAAEAIMSGEVPMAGFVTNSVNAGFSLVANPYPVELALDDIDLTDFNGGERVYTFDGAGYVTYDYFAGYGWFDGLFAPAGGVTIPVGEGFWLSTTNSATLVFDKKY